MNTNSVGDIEGGHLNQKYRKINRDHVALWNGKQSLVSPVWTAKWSMVRAFLPASSSTRCAVAFAFAVAFPFAFAVAFTVALPVAFAFAIVLSSFVHPPAAAV